MSELAIIDWPQALKQMGNDTPFLIEVLSDVMVEARSLLPKLHTAIMNKNGQEVASVGIKNAALWNIS